MATKITTRQFGPDGKGGALSYSEMDLNLLYFQNITNVTSVSGSTPQQGVFTITNPAIKSYNAGAGVILTYPIGETVTGSVMRQVGGFNGVPASVIISGGLDVSGSLLVSTIAATLFTGSFAGDLVGFFSGTGSGILSGDFSGTSSGVFSGTSSGIFNGTGSLNGNLSGTGSGVFNGTGSLSGIFNGSGVFNGTGSLNGNLSGTSSGVFNGTGSLSGIFNGSGSLNGTFTGTSSGVFAGTVSGTSSNAASASYANTSSFALATVGTLTVDNASIELNTGTTFNGAANRTVSVKALGITNAMLAGSITNAKLVNSTISSKALGTNLDTLTIGTGLSGTSYNGSAAVTIANSGVTSNVAGTGVTVSSGTGAVTISIGQSVATSATPTFGNLTVNGTISATGDVTAFASSDKRLKANIKPIEDPIEKLMQISGNTFDWIEGFEEVHPHIGEDVGVIAQEVEEVIPQIVVTRENGYKAVKYEKIVALLIEAVKAQQLEINELKSRL